MRCRCVRQSADLNTLLSQGKSSASWGWTVLLCCCISSLWSSSPKLYTVSCYRTMLLTSQLTPLTIVKEISWSSSVLAHRLFPVQTEVILKVTVCPSFLQCWIHSRWKGHTAAAWSGPSLRCVFVGPRCLTGLDHKWLNKAKIRNKHGGCPV